MQGQPAAVDPTSLQQHVGPPRPPHPGRYRLKEITPEVVTNWRILLIEGSVSYGREKSTKTVLYARADEAKAESEGFGSTKPSRRRDSNPRPPLYEGWQGVRGKSRRASRPHCRAAPYGRAQAAVGGRGRRGPAHIRPTKGAPRGLSHRGTRDLRRHRRCRADSGGSLLVHARPVRAQGRRARGRERRLPVRPPRADRTGARS
jgi:hypothetical protein